MDKELQSRLDTIEAQNKKILFLLNLLVETKDELNRENLESKWLTTNSQKLKEEFVKAYMSCIHDNFSIEPKIPNELTKQH